MIQSFLKSRFPHYAGGHQFQRFRTSYEWFAKRSNWIVHVKTVYTSILILDNQTVCVSPRDPTIMSFDIHDNRTLTSQAKYLPMQLQAKPLGLEYTFLTGALTTASCFREELLGNNISTHEACLSYGNWPEIYNHPFPCLLQSITVKTSQTMRISANLALIIHG